MASTKCPDCGGELNPIKLIDATESRLGVGAWHVELSYEALEPKGFWPIGRSATGRVKGQLCAGCSRIFLYAAPLE